MSGYIEAGYVVALGTLGTYCAALLRRERMARRRLSRLQTVVSAQRSSEIDELEAPSAGEPL